MALSSLLPCVILLLVAVALETQVARAFPSGPPVEEYFNQVCDLMTPLHSDNKPIASTGGYSIETDIPRNGYKGFNYAAGKAYTVTVKSSTATFFGFLVIAHVPGEDHMLLGSFTPQNGSQQTLNCSFTGASNEVASTIGHHNPAKIDFQNITTKWTAPSDKDGMVDFRFTIVHNFTTSYAYQRASLNGLYPPTKNPEDYRLTFRDPPNCIVSECDVFVGIDTNAGDPDFLDIYLEGAAVGWVAVGFTETPDMYSSDVVACNRNPQTSVVQGLDTYNKPDERANDLDPHQNVVQFSSNYSDGRIMCSVAKKIVAQDPPPVNVNLDSDIYILFGRRKAQSLPDSLLTHEESPKISVKKYNPVRDIARGKEDNFPKLSLVRAHGALMLIAWPLFGVSGIFFAAWMRPALPKGQWFQAHRACMLASLFIGAIGIAMVFIGHAHENKPRGLIHLGRHHPVATAHFTIGFIIVLLQIVNPILAAFKCHPDGKWRWAFNLVHGLFIGLGAAVLAFVNVGLGTYVFNDGVSDIFLVYIGYVSFIVVLFGIMFFVFSITVTVIQDPDAQHIMAPFILRPLLKYITTCSYTPINMGEAVKVSYGSTNGAIGSQGSTNQQEGESPQDPKIQLQPTRDSPIRWASLILYLGVSTPLIVAMIIMAAAGAINT